LANNLAQRKVSLTAYITKDAVRDQINRVIGGKDSQKFITSIISAVNANPALQDCENSSILSGALLGASLKLSPSPQLGHYYLVPFNDKNKGKVAQFILGYKGYIQLAIRSGMYKRLNVTAIKEGELIKYDPLTEEIEVSLIEDEDVRENTPTVGYYAMYEYNNGFRKSLYWSKKKMENHANKYSKGYSARKGYTFWEKDFDSMAAKTMIRQLIGKWGIMSIEMQNAYESDGAVINDDGSKNYVELAEDNIINVAAESEETIDNNTASVDVDIDVKDTTTAAAEKAGF
jgi:recombination protein RecT